MLEFIQANQTIILLVASSSVAFFLIALVIIPLVAVRIPAEYFAGKKRPQKQESHYHSRAGWILLNIFKNVIGGVFVLVGIIMLVTPGQGVLTIIVGIMLMNFPGKFKLERWIISRGFTLKFINRLRRKRGRSPLVIGDGSP
jgi:archaellum biogenesis protein FlaJ (TadC family)